MPGYLELAKKQSQRLPGMVNPSFPQFLLSLRTKGKPPWFAMTFFAPYTKKAASMGRWAGQPGPPTKSQIFNLFSL